MGRRIRQLRRDQRLSQEELAARAGLHRNYIGSLERGERDPGLVALTRVAWAFGVSLSELCAPIRGRRRSPA